MNNKKLFLRVNTVILSTFCLLLVGCNKSEPVPTSKEEPQSINPGTSQVIPPDETYNIVRPEFTPEYNDYSIGAEPSGFNMTYYSDVYSRGFSWITDTTAEDTELYLVESDKGETADFSNAQLIQGETKKVTLTTGGKTLFEDKSYPDSGTGSSNSSEQVMYSHKVHVENLKRGKAYSYKVGSSEGYRYGAFIVEKEHAKTITAIHMSDAQTKDPTKLNVWRNTFTNAVDKAGKDLDVALYNGDQFDQNMEKINNVRQLRFNTYSKALDVIQDYKFDIPYMASSGNHEPSARYSQFLHADINYPEGGVGDQGCYYSYDYDYAHFTVLNTNDVSDAQINWLKDDLDNTNAKWKVVMLHISPYSTGDHTNKDANQNIVKKLTPVFSAKHVDLVLQAHDHTYNKTLPYKWDAAGYTTTYNNADVVNFAPQTEKVGDVEYDKNPEGTYYVTTGAAGHRCGSSESTDGVWAEVVKDGDEWKALDSDFTYLNNKYKIEMGKIKYSSTLEAYDGSDDNKKSFHSDQIYEVGHLATGCVNAQMFGVLNMTETTLSYNVYTVSLTREATIFDSIDILKA